MHYAKPLNRYGEVSEWSKEAVLKTVDGNVRGFESYLLRHRKFI